MAFRVIFTMPPFPKRSPTKSTNCSNNPRYQFSLKWENIEFFSDFVGGHFENKNDHEGNCYHYQSILHFKVTLDINVHWNQRTLKFCHWYLGVFWSEEFVGSDELSIQCNFYEPTIFKMAANKIVKLSMVSDFNENWYIRLFWSQELIANDKNCIQGPWMQISSLPFNSSLQNNIDINFHWNRRPLTIWRFCWHPFWKWWPRKNDPE
jgi:hypothetical protein